MSAFVKKGMEVVIVLISLVAAFFIFTHLKIESFFQPDDTPVTASQIASAPGETYTGKTAGDDILRLSGKADFEEMIGKDYATAEPAEVIATGIYGLHPWVDPYSVARRRKSKGRYVGAGKKAPEVVNNAVSALEYYQEYYLIRLSDDTYILAQFSDIYREKMQAGEKVVLPIGIKKTNSSNVKQALQEICHKYGADNTFTLYMIDDEWQQEHENTFFIIKMGIAVVAFFILTVSLLVILYKLEDRHGKKNNEPV